MTENVDQDFVSAGEQGQMLHRKGRKGAARSISINKQVSRGNYMVYRVFTVFWGPKTVHNLFKLCYPCPQVTPPIS
jgi:hypothetical protein